MRTKLNKIARLAEEYRVFAIKNNFKNEDSEKYNDVRIYINNTERGEYFSFSAKGVEVTIFKHFMFENSKENIDVTFDISLTNKQLDAVYRDARQTLKEWRAELSKENE